ncbi:serine/threonine protein kinase [Stagonosporopsis vannaccii]|nr:serine/threonine protein kinase [Stagonosporopsis vannaccii]
MSHQQGKIVIKNVQGYPRVESERDILRRRLQHQTPFLRPLIDEIQEPLRPTAIALRYLDSDLVTEIVTRTPKRNQLNYVCRCVLEALKVLHDENLGHTGKFGMGNIWHPTWDTVMVQPEILMEMPCNTASDIWSFGTLLMSLIYGCDVNLFRSDIKRDHEDHMVHVVME